jgi:LacI family transcriptional regulator
MSTEETPGNEGYLSPARVFAELDDSMADAEELRGRTDGMADRPAHERAAGRYLVGLVTASWEVAELDHPFFGPAFRGIRGRLVSAGCDLILCGNRPVRRGDPARAAALERTIERGADALIVWGVGWDDPEVEPILSSEVPAVFIDLDPIGRRAGYVMSDNVGAMASVVRHLYDTGRRRIAHICGLQNTRPGPDRLFGYRSELDRLGLPAPDEYVESGDYYHRSAYEAAKRLLALPECPDAITCASDIMAIGAMVAIAEAGLRIPDDVAVTGFDDAPFAADIKPSLTTVRQDAAGMGTAAAEAILRMLESPEEPPAATVISSQLVIRESSASQAGQRRRVSAY